MAKGISEFKIGKTLGEGACASVRLGVHKESGKEVAIKTYDTARLMDPQRRLGAEREATILETLSHPGVVGYIGKFRSPGKLHLVMDFPSTQSLHAHVKSFPDKLLPPEACKAVFKQILTAVSYLHAKGVAHRDLKLENVLLKEDGSIVLIDFGFAVQDKGRLRTFCGTPTYMAPEIVCRREYRGNQVDMWALGVLLYRMATGCYPFVGRTDRELEKRIQDGSFNRSIIPDEEIHDTIVALLSVTPTSRMSAKQLLNWSYFAKNHSDESTDNLESSISN